MGKTVSEKLFEQHCDRHNISCCPLSTRENVQTADYLILLDSEKVVVEVKQIDANNEDQDLVEAANSGEAISYWSDGRFRVREKIKSAAGQLKSSVAKYRCPSILILFDNTGIHKLDSEDILNAMYGEEVVDVLIPDDQNAETKIDGHRFGGGRQTTETERRYISAIGWLRRNLMNGEWELALFHNRFAALSLPPNIALQIANNQFKLSNSETNRYGRWERIDISN